MRLKKMISRLLVFIPAGLIRGIGRLQFKAPMLAPIINRLAQFATTEGVIQRGVGKGLIFDATGCNPGFLTGTSEPREQQLVAQYARPGGVIYDLGANAGFYVLIAARLVGDTGRVYAFEPAPLLCSRIKHNCISNGFTNVEVYDTAISDVDGEIAFGIVGDLSVSNSIYAANSTGSTRVKSTTLDRIAPGLRPPTLIIVDIEGAELKALQSGLQMIKQSMPVIMVEVHWLGDEFLEFVESSLVPLGYAATTYRGDSLPKVKSRYHALLLPSTSRGRS